MQQEKLMYICRWCHKHVLYKDCLFEPQHNYYLSDGTIQELGIRCIDVQACYARGIRSDVRLSLDSIHMNEELCQQNT